MIDKQVVCQYSTPEQAKFGLGHINVEEGTVVDNHCLSAYFQPKASSEKIGLAQAMSMQCGAAPKVSELLEWDLDFPLAEVTPVKPAKSRQSCLTNSDTPRSNASSHNSDQSANTPAPPLSCGSVAGVKPPPADHPSSD